MNNTVFYLDDTNWTIGMVREDVFDVSVRLVWERGFKEELLKLEEKLNKEKEIEYTLFDHQWNATLARNNKIMMKGYNIALYDGRITIGFNINKKQHGNIAFRIHYHSGALLKNDCCEMTHRAIKYLVGNKMCNQPSSKDIIITYSELCRDLNIPVEYYIKARQDDRYITRFKNSFSEFSEDNPVVTIDDALQKSHKRHVDVLFGVRHTFLVRIYDKDNELDRNPKKKGAYLSAFKYNGPITRFEVGLNNETLKCFPTHNGLKIDSLERYEQNRINIFHHCFTKKIRIPKKKYGKTNSIENTPEWDLVTDGLIAPPLYKPIKAKKYIRSETAIDINLTDRALSMAAEMTIHDNHPVNHLSLDKIFLKRFSDSYWIDRYYNHCARWLKKYNAISGSRPVTLEYHMVEQYLRQYPSEYEAMNNKAIPDIELARKHFKPRFAIGYEYGYPDKVSNPFASRILVTLHSYGHSIFRYDFQDNRAKKSMTFRAAWMSYLLSSEAEEQYKNNLYKADRYIKANDLRTDIFNLMKDAYNHAISTSHLNVAEINYYKIMDNKIIEISNEEFRE